MIQFWDLHGVQSSGILAHILTQSLVNTFIILETNVPDLLV
jgi:hypothetical protein